MTKSLIGSERSVDILNWRTIARGQLRKRKACLGRKMFQARIEVRRVRVTSENYEG
jgi:hypothetical protein